MLWVKVFHIVMVIAWMAGLFYLPRIFVHYLEGLELGEDVRRLRSMARKLFSFMTVVAIQALAAGLWLWLGFGLTGEWLYAKLLFVGALIGYQVVCWYYLQKMLMGEFNGGARRMRLFNELPLLLLVPIIIFAVVKPI